jgi:hypothetical protein
MNRLPAALVFMALVACAAYADFPKEIKIGEETVPCLSVEECRALGLSCEDIPWEENAASVYLQAMNAYEALPGKLEMAITVAAGKLDFTGLEDDARNHFEKNKAFFDLLDKADKMLRYCFPEPKPGEALPQVLHLKPFLSFGRDLSYSAAYDFWSGKHREAIEKCFHAMRIGKRLSQGNYLGEGLIGVGIDWEALRRLDRMVASGEMTDAELQEVMKGLDEMKSRLPDLAPLFKTERAVIMMSIPYVQKQGGEALGLGKGIIPNEPVWREGFDGEAAKKNLNEVFDFYDEQVKKPAYVALAPGNRFSDFEKKHAAKWDQMTEFLAPLYEPAVVKYTDLRAQVDLLELRSALERCKLATKSYPKALDQLAPAILRALPTDPYSGKPYLYRVTDAGEFFLWSVGEDLKDGGGKYPGLLGYDSVISSDEYRKALR